jgi:hypothetical protein
MIKSVVFYRENSNNITRRYSKNKYTVENGDFEPFLVEWFMIYL